MIVLDANILIRAVLGRHVRHLLQRYTAMGVRFYCPWPAYEDAERYARQILLKQGKPIDDLDGLFRYLRVMAEPLSEEFYRAYEAEARERLSGRDEEDWPILASAFALNCPVWSEDFDFFGTGVAVWTSSRVEIYLKGQAKLLQMEGS